MERQPWGGRVVVADKTRVIVRVNALLPRQARGGGHRVGGPIAPGILIVRRRQRDRNVAAQQVNDVGLSRGGNRDDRGDEPVRVRHTVGPLTQTRPISTNHGCRRIENLPRCR